MDTQLLQDIGLSEGEVKVYIALLKLGTATTGPLAAEAQVSSSKVYKILGRLEKKGLVGYMITSKVRYFTAMAPRRVLDYIDEREQQLAEKKKQVEQMIPLLELQQKMQENKATVYEGIKGTTNLLKNMLDELKPGESYYVMHATYGEVYETLRPFLHQHHQRRAGKNITVHMLANHGLKGKLEPTTYKKSKIRYLPSQFISNMPIFFYNNKAIIMLWTKQPMGFLIESKEAVKSFKAQFDALWKIARP